MAEGWDDTQHAWDDLPDEEDLGPVLQRRPIEDDADMDITPMIDITFLLLIFFLVASVPDPQTAVELPPAVHGTAVAPAESVVITVAEGNSPGEPAIYLANGKQGSPLAGDFADQDEQIAAHIEAEGKMLVLIKAERGVLHRDVSRVATAAAQVEGVTLHVAVLETE